MTVVHRGTVEACGFVLDPALLGTAEVRRRVLALWAPGCRVLAGADVVIVLTADARRVRRDRAPGEPIVREGGLLAAAPVPEDCPAPTGSLYLHRAGEPRVLQPHALAVLDPAAWLDVPLTQPDVVALGPLPRPPALVAKKAAANARAAFDAVPELDPEAAEAIRSLEAEAHPGAEPGKRPSALRRWWQAWFGRGQPGRGAAGGGRPGAGAGGSPRAGGLLSRLMNRLRGRTGVGSTRAPLGSKAPPQPGLLQRLMDRARLGLLVSQLGKLFTMRQARYLADLMRRLEGGDLEEALRRALPLGKGAGAGGPSLGLPSPRAELRIDPGRGVGGGSSMVLGDQLYEKLRELYRAAFRRLEQAGKLQEAAFVLADLLDEAEEAVSFLEGHKEYELAARLAEARDLPPGLVVRQWFLAGDAERAMQVARRHGAFADAVRRLEGDGDKAGALRVLWARLLAAEGDYVGAVRAIWPVPTARRIAEHWLERGIEAGGPGGAELLARKATETEAPWEALAGPIAELAAEPGWSGELARRSAVAYLERSLGRPTFAEAMARALVRPMLRDAAAHRELHYAPLKRVLKLAGDPILKADKPAAGPTVRSPGDGAPPRVWSYAAADRGLQPVHDVAWLLDGRMLVALGEAGLLLVGRDGRERHRFDQPCARLVLRAGGQTAIGLAPRGEGNWCLARFDLQRRTARRWCDARLDAWAPDHAGLWFVAHDRTITAVDPLAEGFGGLWRIPDVKGHVLGLHRSEFRLSFAVQDPTGVEVWWVALPALQLRRRMPIELGGLGVDARALGFDPDGNVLIPGVELDADAEATDVLRCYRERQLLHTYRQSVDWAEAGLFGRPTSMGSLVALPTRTERGHDVQVVQRGNWAMRVRVWLDGASVVTQRFTDHVLAIGDDQGRALAVDTRTGGLLHDLRV